MHNLYPKKVEASDLVLCYLSICDLRSSFIPPNIRKVSLEMCVMILPQSWWHWLADGHLLITLSHLYDLNRHPEFTWSTKCYLENMCLFNTSLSFTISVITKNQTYLQLLNMKYLAINTVSPVHIILTKIIIYFYYFRIYSHTGDRDMEINSIFLLQNTPWYLFLILNSLTSNNISIYYFVKNEFLMPYPNISQFK